MAEENKALVAWDNFEKVEVTDHWYDVYKMPGNVYAIYEPGQIEQVISYLIIGKDKALLWDTGTGVSDIKKTAEELTDLTIYVLNSHSHFDHTGGNALFNSENIFYYDLEFAKDALTQGVPNDEIKSEVYKEALTRELPKGFDPESYCIKGKVPGIPKKAGDIIDIGNRKLEIWPSPGHSPDNIVLHDKENAILFTGDTYYPDTLYCVSPGSDLKTYAKTLRKLADEVGSYDISWLYGAHTGTAQDLNSLDIAARALESIICGAKTDFEPFSLDFINAPLRHYLFPDTGIDVLVLESEF